MGRSWRVVVSRLLCRCARRDQGGLVGKNQLRIGARLVCREDGGVVVGSESHGITLMDVDDAASRASAMP
jgi:hypothetical protein